MGGGVEGQSRREPGMGVGEGGRRDLEGESF